MNKIKEKKTKCWKIENFAKHKEEEKEKSDQTMC